MPSNIIKVESAIYGVFAAFANVVILIFAYLVIGVITGVFGGMCSFAPEWWASIYLWVFVLILILGIAAGILIGFRHSKNSIENSIKLK